MMDGGQARFPTPQHTLCILYLEPLVAEGCKLALQSQRSLMKFHHGPGDTIRLDSISRQTGEELAATGLPSLSPSLGALTPEFHRSSLSGSEPRLRPSLTFNCLFHLRFEENYVGRAVAREAETSALESAPCY